MFRQMPKMRDWFMKLVVKPRAVLYQNSYVQIGCEHKYQGARGQVCCRFVLLAPAPFVWPPRRHNCCEPRCPGERRCSGPIAVRSQVMLFLGNKSEHTLNDFSVTSTASDEVQVKVGDAPGSVGGKCQAKIQVMVRCMKPFNSPPAVTLKFVCNGSLHTYPLRLPVVATSFVATANMDAQRFMGSWRSS